VYDYIRLVGTTGVLRNVSEQQSLSARCAPVLPPQGVRHRCRPQQSMSKKTDAIIKIFPPTKPRSFLSDYHLSCEPGKGTQHS